MVIPKAALVRNNLQHNLAPLPNSACGLQRLPDGMFRHETADVPRSQIIWSRWAVILVALTIFSGLSLLLLGTWL